MSRDEALALIALEQLHCGVVKIAYLKLAQDRIAFLPATTKAA